MQKQGVFILEKRFYCHPLFSNYAALKDGEIINVKTRRILKIQKIIIIIRGIANLTYVIKI